MIQCLFTKTMYISLQKYGNINTKYYIPNSRISKFDLSLEVIPEDNKLNLSFEYMTELFDKEFIEIFSKHYLDVLTAILQSQDIQIADIDIFSKDEKINNTLSMSFKERPEEHSTLNIKSKSKKTTLPRSDLDLSLIDILKDLLGIINVNIDDSFFDLGGDSLTAINLCIRIYNEFGVQISVKDILDNPIIKDLSDLISSKNGTQSNNNSYIEKATESAYYPVSSAQKRTYYASNLAGTDSILYNISGGLILDNMPDIPKLKNAFKKLVQRQSSLRTYFKLNGEEVVQKIDDNINFNLNIASESIEKNNLESEFKSFVKPFDLSKAPLFRAKLIPLEENKAFLLIDMHHIISDRNFTRSHCRWALQNI